MNQPSPSIEFTHERSVDASHIDINGHVNNVVFVQWMQDLAVLHWKAVNGTFVLFVDLTTGRPRKLPKTFTDLFNFDDTSTGRSADKQTPINTSRR